MPFHPGDLLLNKYRIEALIGQGAFGEVYHATHLALNAPRALKILRRDAPGVGSSEFTDFHARFQLEAQLGAKLDHPNIIRVYDFEQDGETLILTMEYAEGGSLAQRIQQAREKDQPILVAEAVQIALDIANGLSALHALDAVHRDLKPSNILFDAKGYAKVADLGLAQIPGGPSLRSKLSQPLPHPGTPGYMSPEQEHTGNLLRPASDVYALGIVLFEMLTGRAYSNQRPETRPKSLRADIPQWLDDLLARMLAGEPNNRPWDGAEAADLLREGMAREEVAHREAEEDRARREEQARQQRAADEKARRDTEERATREAEARERRKTDERVRRAAEQSAHMRSKNTFLTAGGILAGIVFMSIACMAIYALIILPRQKAATAAQEATIQAQNAQVAQAMTQTTDAFWTSYNTPYPYLPLAISPTPNFAASSPTVSPTPVIVAPPTPADFISSYYGTINNGDYQSAWSMLSQNFKDTYNKSGYQPYADWWRTIREVEIISITVNYQNADYAGLSVELSCYFTNGNVDTYDLMEFTLKWDSSRGQWFIDDGRLVKGTR